MQVKNYIVAVLAFAMAAFLLVHFGFIAIYGKFYIYESNRYILFGEITFVVAIMAFSLYCLLENLIEARAKHTHLKLENHNIPVNYRQNR